MNNQQIKYQPAPQQSDSIRNESRVMYAVVAVVLLSAAFADVKGFYQSLLSSFVPEMAAAIAICLVVAFELSLTVFCLGLRNLFALGKMSMQSWTFYAVLTLFSMFGSFHLGGLLMDNVHAVGVKNRAFTNAVKYDDDPLLSAARDRVAQISGSLDATEKTITSIAAPMRQAGFAASGFSQRAGDTTLTAASRREQLWNASRANKSQSSLGAALLDASKEKSRLLVEKLRAQDRLDSLMSALDARYRHKSPEDFAEASIGRNLLADISSATVWASLLAIASLVMVRAYASGVIEYRTLIYKPAGGEKRHDLRADPATPEKLSVGAVEDTMTRRQVDTLAVPSDNVILPVREAQEERSIHYWEDQYFIRIGKMYLRGVWEQTPQKVIAQLLGLTQVEMTRLLNKIRGQGENLKENKNGKSSLKDISVETI